MNHWKIATSVYNKIIAKCPQGTYQRCLTKQPNSEFPLRQNYGVPWTDVKRAGRGGVNNFKTVNSYPVATNNKIDVHTRFLNFNTEQERYNAWQSYLTKFARFCVMLDESTKLAPYMEDYTEPWTDERFKQYFGLTDIEWQLIDTVIKD